MRLCPWLSYLVRARGANDDDFLYFLMRFKEVEVTAAITVDGNTTCRFYIDIIPGGDASKNFADYCIIFKTDLVSFSGVAIPVDEAVLDYWTGTFWDRSDCTDVQGASTDFFVEVAVAWDCIGGPTCFNCDFSASALSNPTDYVPDHGALYDVIGCCPGIHIEPVGGEILSSKPLLAETSVSVTVLSVLAAGVLGFYKKKHYH